MSIDSKVIPGILECCNDIIADGNVSADTQKKAEETMNVILDTIKSDLKDDEFAAR